METPSKFKYDSFRLFEDRDFYILWIEFYVLSNILLDESYLMTVSQKRSFYKRFRLLNSRIVRLIEDIDDLNIH